MKTKLRFLFVLLTILWWGANFAWGNTYVISWGSGDPSPSTTYVQDGSDFNYTATFSNGLSMTYTRNTNDKELTASGNYIKYSNGVKYTIAGVPNTEKITSVAFTGFPNSSTSDDCYIEEFNGTSGYGFISGINDFNNATSNSTKTVTFSSLNILSGGFTFTPRGSQLDLIITITTEDIPTNTTTINIADLRYEHYYFGSDLERNVAGFIITASSEIQSYNDNNTYYLLVKNNETITVAPNSSNSSAIITNVRVVMDDNSYVDVPNNNTGAVQCKNTSGSAKNVAALVITTDRTMTTEKVTPVLTFNPTSDTYDMGNTELKLGDLNTGLLRTSPKAFRLDYSVSNSGSSTTAEYHLSGKYLGITPGSTAGTATITASFGGNDYFNGASANFTAIIAGGTFTGEYSVATTGTVDGATRNLSGTYTFTGTGTVAGGKVIDDVPGITMTIGTVGETLGVVDNSVSAVGYAASSTSFVFIPKVNGYLTINMHSNNGHTYIRKDGGIFLDALRIDGEDDYTYTTPNEFPLIAGHTYMLHVRTTDNNGNPIAYNNIFVHSFTFRPAFLNPGETAEQTETFPAYISTTDYPKLVHSADAGVRFSGTRSVVNLTNTGGVTLVGGGTATVRGEVTSGNNSLTAYYTLDAKALKLTGTTPTSGKTITSLDNSVFRFIFDEEIAVGENPSFQVLKDAADMSGCSIAVSTNTGETDYKKTLYVSGFGTLEGGSTYTIRLFPGAVTKAGNSNIANGQVTGSFTVTSDEPTLTWLYPTPTSAVRIGASIVLLSDSKIDEHFPTDGVIGTLTYEGQTEGETITMTAIKDSERLIFKPTRPLEPNKSYKLTVEGGRVKKDGADNKISKDKVFFFNTGTATGAEPIMTSATPSLDNSTTSMTYEGGTIEFVFDQNVELEPYSTINVTPVNGANPTVFANSPRLNNKSVLTEQSLHVDNNRVYFTYSEDELKYDLYYEIEFPVNTVTGTGGMPNSETKIIKFKMQPRPSSLVSGTKDFDGYPHTWNFTNIGTKDVESATNTLTALATYSTDANKATSGWYTYDGYYGNYNFNNSGIKFPQGDVLSYNNGSSNIEIKEASGLRWSLNKNTGNSAANRVSINPGANTTYLKVTGNTHYLTIPNVPVGKLYIKAKYSDMLNINSPNAVFVQGGTSSNNTKGTTTRSSKVYILDVTKQDDVSFCLDDVTFEMIAVATEEKAISSVGYATNARSFPVDYTLDGTLLGTGVTAYKITGVNGNSVVAEPVEKVPATTELNPNNGVMLQGAEGSWPLFTLDVNSTEETLTDNKLVGVVDGESADPLPQKSGSLYNYILSTGGVNVKYNYEGKVGDEENQQGTFGGYVSGLAFYLVMKAGTILENGAEYAYEKPKSNTAYLQLPSYLARQTGTGVSSSARQYFPIDFGDETTSVTGIEDDSRSSMKDDSWISLQGVRVEKPGKGLYIHKGKKIVIK